MAFTRATTFPALYGGPGPASAPLGESGSVTDTLSVAVTDISSLLMSVAISVSDTVSVSIADSSSLVAADVNLYRTQPGLYGGPVPYVLISDKSVVTTFNLDVSDTLSVQWLEEPVDEQDIVTAETLRVAVNDSSAIFNFLAVSDPIGIALNETVALLIAGITTKSVTDSLSVALAESVALNVSLSVTDTVSFSLADTSALAASTLAISVTDSLAIAITEDSLLQVFTGVVQLSVTDDLNLLLGESLSVVRTTPPITTGPVESIRFEIRGPSMRFEFL